MTVLAIAIQRRSVCQPHRGFTLLEMLMVVAIISMLAVLLVPRSRPDERMPLRAAAALLVSDIELAQVMNISNPKNAVVVRFDAAAGTYWLARKYSPEDPILRAGTDEPYLVTMGAGRAAAAAGITFQLDNLADNTLKFSAHGSLADPGAQPSIRLRWGGQAAKYETRITIAPTTGSISVTQVPLLVAEAAEEL